MKDKEKVYGLSEDPWPYDYVIDSLIFFSLKVSDKDAYFATVDRDKWIEYSQDDIYDHIVQGFARDIIPGLDINEWINNTELEKAGLEDDFAEFLHLGMNKGTDRILENWKDIPNLSRRILNKLKWPKPSEPFTSSDEMLEDYKHRDLGDGWGW